jgi:HTH-type transcriptional regulator, sugar sensing transcriptional regulator
MKRIPSLEALGLTRLESLAYSYLVANPATTGYRVSKGIGKPTANVYRALESLERKGAVRNDHASPPLFRAVPPAELLDQLEREFMDRREIASQALESLTVGTDTDDDGMFALATADQVLGRARILLTAARRLALVDAAPEAFAQLTDTIDDARARGVRLVVRVRGPVDTTHTDTMVDTAPGAQAAGALRLVADAREALLATITAEGTGARDAIWTRSSLFARTLHEALATDLFYGQVERGLEDGLSVDELEGFFERCRHIRSLK